MTSFLSTPKGGIQPISGKAGLTIENLTQANRGTPGHNIIVNVVNQIEAATRITISPNACDPEIAIQRTQQQFQKRVQQILENYIIEQIKVEVGASPILDLQKELQNLQAQGITESLSQQIEIVNKQIQSELSTIIVGVIGRASTQLPQVAKVANTSAAGLKTVASVAESLAGFVPSQGINMSAYGGVQKTIQTVSQACSI